MKKWIPVDSYNITAIEEWLAEMARSGLRLVKIGRDWASFEKMDPGRLSYHIEPKGEDEKEDRKAYEELGWSYLCDMGGTFDVYTTPRKTLKLPPREKKNVKNLRKKQRHAIASPMLMLLLMVFFFALGMQLYVGEVALLALDDAVIGLYAVLIIFSIQEIGMGIRRSLFLKRLEAGKPTSVTHRRSRALVCILLAALLLAEGCLFGVRRSQRYEVPIGEVDVPYASLEEVESAAVAEEFSLKEFGNTAKFAASFAVPVQWEFRQSGQLSSGAESVMRVRREEAVSEKLAGSLVWARMAADLHWNDRLQAAEVSVEGADEAYMASYQSIQYLFMRKGTQVVSVYYLGEQDLSKRLDVFVKMLEE